MMSAQQVEDRSILVVFMNVAAYGLDRATGQVRWRTEVDCKMMAAEIAIASGWVVVCTDTHLHFLDYATGRLANSIKHEIRGAGMRPIMLVDAGQILVGCAGEVVAYSTSGQPLWHQPLRGAGAGSMALGLPGNVRQADER